MTKQNASLKRCLLIGIFALLLFLALPAKVTWAGCPAQTVPTVADPSSETAVPPAQPTAAPTKALKKSEPQPTQANPVPRAISTTANHPTPSLESATPRVFPTRAEKTQLTSANGDLIATTSPIDTAPVSSSPTAAQGQVVDAVATAGSTVSVERPVTASLTAVAAEENSAGGNSNSSLLFCSSGLIALVVLTSLGFIVLHR